MRFIPHTEADVAAMLQTIGVAHIDDLIAHVPENLRNSAAIKLAAGRTEAEVAAELSALAAANRGAAGFIAEEFGFHGTRRDALGGVGSARTRKIQPRPAADLGR